MSKKTLALVAGLTVLTLVLVVLALNTGQNTVPPQQTGNEVATSTPTPTAPAHTTVRLFPDPVSLTAGKGTVSVMIDTVDNEVTGVQFDLVYDPKLLTIGEIQKGDFLKNAIVLPTNTQTPGRITYMLGLTPASYQTAKAGSGTVASFTVTRRAGAAVDSAPLTLENVYISAKGLRPSVLKEALGTTVNLSSTTNSSASSSGR